MAHRVPKCSGNVLILGIFGTMAIFSQTSGHALGTPESNFEPRYSLLRNGNNEDRTGPVPSCANTTFCTDTPYYPSDLIDVLLTVNEDLKYLATVDAPLDPFRQYYKGNEEPLCDSQEMVISPKTAQTAGGRWLYVVNYKEYIQTVRVEICMSENLPCKFVDGFSDGWTTLCKQTYIYRQLVAITLDGRIAPQIFKLPASCKCYVKYSGDPFRRFNSTSKMSTKLKLLPEQRKLR